MEVVGSKCGGTGGVEVRRIHIIYFLWRMGRVEHPHLIRVHHLNKNGVYLRDVKRWLVDLRGKDMPEAFSWSFKRRYKSGYVWQDLLDDDLITPISDNEFVLKGSEIIPSVEKRATQSNDDNRAQQQQQTNHKPDFRTKLMSEIHRESPVFGSERSTLTDISTKHKHDDDDDDDDEEELIDFSDSIYTHLLDKQRMKKTSNGNGNSGEIEVKEKTAENTTEMTTEKPTIPVSASLKKKSNSNGASQMLRNLMSCGGVETNEAVLVRLNEWDKKSGTGEICKGEKIGGSARFLPTPTNNHQQQQRARKSFDGSKSSNTKKEQNNPKTAPVTYKPVREPICSLCGKCFKPEKMNSHMKSCTGFKALSKTPATFCDKNRSLNKETTSGSASFLARSKLINSFD